MVASCAFDGDLAEAEEHKRFLQSFSPDFLPSVVKGQLTLFQHEETRARLIEGLQRADVGRGALRS